MSQEGSQRRSYQGKARESSFRLKREFIAISETKRMRIAKQARSKAQQSLTRTHSGLAQNEILISEAVASLRRGIFLSKSLVHLRSIQVPH